MPGGSWCNPPPKEKILEVSMKYESEMKYIIEKEISLALEKNMESWGFKDPRTSLTIEGWCKFLPNPQFVVCYRSPLDIAKSLQKRNGFSIERGMNLTREYNTRILQFLESFDKQQFSENLIVDDLKS